MQLCKGLMFMLKNSKIFLLSSKKRHYRMLIQKGYDNILWLKSDYEAVDYTNRYPDNIDTIDCIFIDKELYNGKSGEKRRLYCYKNRSYGKRIYIQTSANNT